MLRPCLPRLKQTHVWVWLMLWRHVHTPWKSSILRLIANKPCTFRIEHKLQIDVYCATSCHIFIAGFATTCPVGVRGCESYSQETVWLSVVCCRSKFTYCIVCWHRGCYYQRHGLIAETSVSSILFLHKISPNVLYIISLSKFWQAYTHMHTHSLFCLDKRSVSEQPLYALGK